MLQNQDHPSAEEQSGPGSETQETAHVYKWIRFIEYFFVIYVIFSLDSDKHFLLHRFDKLITFISIQSWTLFFDDERA